MDNNNAEVMKNLLFQDLDYYQVESRELYDLADALRSHDKFGEATAAWVQAKAFEEKFQELLNFIKGWGWDKEYMGIA